MSRPLAGRRVVVTRPAGQARELVQRLTALGAQVVELPLTRIETLVETAQIDAALNRIAAYDIIVVTSANGADCFADRLVASGTEPDERTTIIAVGAATAAALRGRGVRVDRIPQRATGEAIVAELAHADLTGVRILLPRAREGRPELPAGLSRAGAIVDDVAFYDTVRCPVAPEAVQAALAADDIVLTAPSGVEAFAALVGDARNSRLRIVTIGPTTSAAVRDLGLTVSVESAEQSSDGLIAAIVALGPAPE
jgi:uroporphyrinogen III methyltransferase/synthase